MSNYIFLTETYNEGDTIYYAIPDEKIQPMRFNETYDNYGQLLTPEDAQDFTINNSACDAARECKKAIAEKFGIEYNNIHFVTDGTISIEAGDGEEYGFDEQAVNDFIAEWQKENESFTMCKGFTFWNGHNWQSVVTEMDDHTEVSWEIVSDEALVAELNKAIEEKEFVKEGFGKKLYEANGWTVEDNYCQGVWDSYRVYAADVEQD